MDLHWWHDFVETIAHGVGTIAIGLGGYWTYTRFIKAREHIWNLQFHVEPRVEELDVAFGLLVVTVRMKNIGKVVITNTPGEMFQINLYINLIDINSNSFNINNTASKNNSLNNHNYLRRFDMLSEYKEEYTLEPGVEYQEVEVLKVKRGFLYAIKAEFSDPKWKNGKYFISDLKYIYVNNSNSATTGLAKSLSYSGTGMPIPPAFAPPAKMGSEPQEEVVGSPSSSDPTVTAPHTEREAP